MWKCKVLVAARRPTSLSHSHPLQWTWTWTVTVPVASFEWNAPLALKPESHWQIKIPHPEGCATWYHIWYHKLLILAMISWFSKWLWYHDIMVLWYPSHTSTAATMISTTYDIIGLWYHDQYHSQYHVWYHASAMPRQESDSKCIPENHMEQLRVSKIQSKSSLKFDKTSDQALHIYNAIKRVLLNRRRTGGIMAKRTLKW